MPDFPKPTITVDYDAIANRVWTWATRTLTDFTGKPRVDLLGEDRSLAEIGYTAERASRLDNLDVPVSTRSTLTAAEVWSYTTRTLTEFKGQPRIDLLGEDADFERGTGARKSLIDRLAGIESHEPSVEGTATFAPTDTYPRSIVLIDTSTMNIAGRPHLVDGYIDLSQLAPGESITVREYMIIRNGGSPVKYAEETYVAPIDPPLLHITTKPAKYGLVLEIVMNAPPSGTRSLDYQLFVKSTK